MRRVVRESDVFARDFESHFAWYLTEAGERVSDRFKTAVKQTITRIQNEPTLGRIRHFRNPQLRGLRSFGVNSPFEKNLIFYRFDGSEIQLWRLMHGARNLSQRLLEPND